MQQNTQLDKEGYAIENGFYSETEISTMIACLENAEQSSEGFLITKDLFAIRQLLKNVPDLKEHLFNTSLTALLTAELGSEYFLTKSIYFDKPSVSNWFVAYHQDLSISVNQKVEIDGYKNWTYKKKQYGVQPPINVLENTVTVRIHLDTTTKENGALKIIPQSHSKGIIRPESKDWETNTEVICEVEKGGVMLMKPLTLHASNRTTNNKRRRVIHLEFSNERLTPPLDWLEFEEV